MLIDEAHLHIKAGHGGPGKVCFDTVPRSLGPTGGNGGNGGSVYAEGVSDLSALRQYRFKKDFSAQDGTRGGEAKRTGAAGADLVLKVPIGTVISAKLLNAEALTSAEGSGGMHHGITEKEFEVTRVGERILIAQGGLGGRGNFMFRSAHNPSPEYAQPGLPGEEFEATFELRLIAHVGLIGLPNAGKSSLLNELTKAGAKVANYPFTTLEPNLGVYYAQSVLHASDEEQAKATPLIIADIPGLIEGASTGRGLGHKFLRHVQRTKVLLHCVSAESQDVSADYKAVRDELVAYDKELAQKDTFILLTKSDVVDEVMLKKQVTALKRFKKPLIVVSIHNPEQLSTVRAMLDALTL